jgi:U5 small nuclear ribonucleoprotein component
LPQERYTDISNLSRSRGISLKSAPLSLVLGTTKGKSHLVNLLDTPGHPNFLDEVAASMRSVDGVVLVVDVVEGVMVGTEKVVEYAIVSRVRCGARVMLTGCCSARACPSCSCSTSWTG